EIQVLVDATAEDRAAISWLSALKNIAFVYEFALEVLREKLQEHDSVLRHSDYETFVDKKSETHPELSALKSSSKHKIQLVLVRMLLEVGLLRKGAELGTILRPVLSPKVLHVINSDSPRWLAGFLVPDYEIGGSSR